ncbi:hypothetical protein A3F02_02960 [Candidatus Curtissbacteria bacterium RIFCSPHIGHO2_12_FULL_38_9b]|uniref:Uncharacterized protein n=2 Tax=Candidatus Curtissiibacteriota TaxID=1752717 RepID=A0A1F5GZH3_9BACT|nr:MAG: hypothetical protein A3A48_04125 [Candidatus Curtissbacteria bacterium RIFCSPLOWO2_01_FULL_37_9]OGD97219.1 MAG: hypothetical protein A3F02_02960 [Candidatus Curtissbacteria bacterium RIFCSPHIGHO2_12_FULL_38_9b]
MKVETTETEVKGHRHTEIITTRDLPTFQEVGSKHDVSIGVIANEGEKYTSYEGLVGNVPEGKVHVAITSPKADVGDFWKELKEVRAKQQEPSGNP